MMNERLDWMQKLGDAVLAQQAGLMDAVQRLRAKARAQGTLTDTREQKVTVEVVTPSAAPAPPGASPPPPPTVIKIEPADPQVVYVPTYNPTVVYQKDLGPNTATLAREMRRYDPDSTWTKVDIAAVAERTR